MRALLAPGPQLTVSASANGRSVLLSGRVQGEQLSNVRVSLLDDRGRELARHPRVPVAFDGSFSDRFELSFDAQVELELAVRGFRGSTVVLSSPIQLSTH